MELISGQGRKKVHIISLEDRIASEDPTLRLGQDRFNRALIAWQPDTTNV